LWFNWLHGLVFVKSKNVLCLRVKNTAGKQKHRRQNTAGKVKTPRANQNTAGKQKYRRQTPMAKHRRQNTDGKTAKGMLYAN